MVPDILIYLTEFEKSPKRAYVGICISCKTLCLINFTYANYIWQSFFLILTLFSPLFDVFNRKMIYFCCPKIENYCSRSPYKT